ncbi:hypothetical protein KHP62_03125 [Rhodobacteraceae bacterium NNCM2]|nr:hypothetical protein [Coraliihabitans acroporae]
MTTDRRIGKISPRARFLASMERCVRWWFHIALFALVLGLFDIRPTLVGILAYSGPIWVAIMGLVYWGRMLDETMNFRSDHEDGPR